MSAKRIFVDSIEINSNFIVVPSTDLHYLFNVLRLKTGTDVIVITKESNKKYLCKINKTNLDLIQELPIETITGQRIKSMLLALSKPKAMEFAIEKVTEHNLENLIIFKAENSVPSLSNSENKIKRYTTISESAARQCQRDRLMNIHLADSAIKALKLWEQIRSTQEELTLCSLNKSQQLLYQLSAAYQAVIIGPEGDLSPAEQDFFIKSGATRISLGNTILRVETAAISAMAMGWR